MFISFRVRRYIGWVCAGVLALLIVLVVLHRSISTVSGRPAEEETASLCTKTTCQPPDFDL